MTKGLTHHFVKTDTDSVKPQLSKDSENLGSRSLSYGVEVSGCGLGNCKFNKR